MSYKEQIFKRALKAVADIYEISKYDEDVDLYRSFDIINSVNENQFASKEWLVKNLITFIDQEKLSSVCVLGGWYGLLAVMMSQEVSKDVRIDTVDCDPESKKFGQAILDLSQYDNINFRIEDAESWFHERPKLYDVIINTSCEHMEPDEIRMMVKLKREDAIVCFQGNNYHRIQSHINTHNSLEEFVESLDLKQVLFKDSMPAPGGEYDRYMVIGK